MGSAAPQNFTSACSRWSLIQHSGRMEPTGKYTGRMELAFTLLRISYSSRHEGFADRPEAPACTTHHIFKPERLSCGLNGKFYSGTRLATRKPSRMPPVPIFAHTATLRRGQRTGSQHHRPVTCQRHWPSYASHLPTLSGISHSSRRGGFTGRS